MIGTNQRMQSNYSQRNIAVPMVNIYQSVKTVDLLCLIDEERLNPYGVGNLPHVLTIHIWSQRKS